MKTLSLLAALVVAIGSWWHGYRTGVLAERDHVRESLFAERETSRRLQSELATRLETLQAERDQADAMLEALGESVAGDHRLETADIAELELYRRIAGASSSRGVYVDRVALSADDPSRLSVTLIQVRGRGRVTGRIGLLVHGRDGDRKAIEPIANLDDDSARSFGFRFFETLEIDLPDTIARPIEAVEIHVEPDGREFSASEIVVPGDEIVRIDP